MEFHRKPPAIERNGSRKSVNIISAAEISKNFDSIVNVYSSDERITSNAIIKFFKKLLNINKNKRVFMIWDNARVHASKAVQEFISQHEEKLFI